MQWGWGKEFTGLVILMFILLQLIGSGLVIFGKDEFISLGCRMLAAYVVLVILSFPVYWSPFFFVRYAPNRKKPCRNENKFQEFSKTWSTISDISCMHGNGKTK